MIVQVRKAQAEKLLALRADVEMGEQIVRQSQMTLNAAAAGILAGVVPEGTNLLEVYVKGTAGFIVTGDADAAAD